MHTCSHNKKSGQAHIPHTSPAEIHPKVINSMMHPALEDIGDSPSDIRVSIALVLGSSSGHKHEVKGSVIYEFMWWGVGCHTYQIKFYLRTKPGHPMFFLTLDVQVVVF